MGLDDYLKQEIGNDAGKSEFESVGNGLAKLILLAELGNFKAGDVVPVEKQFTFLNKENGWELQ